MQWSEINSRQLNAYSATTATDLGTSLSLELQIILIRVAPDSRASRLPGVHPSYPGSFSRDLRKCEARNHDAGTDSEVTVSPDSYASKGFSPLLRKNPQEPAPKQRRTVSDWAPRINRTEGPESTISELKPNGRSAILESVKSKALPKERPATEPPDQ